MTQVFVVAPGVFKQRVQKLRCLDAFCQAAFNYMIFLTVWGVVEQTHTLNLKWNAVTEKKHRLEMS